ncbi:MAG: hypothetical protein WCR42_07825 [bacterium]
MKNILLKRKLRRIFAIIGIIIACLVVYEIIELTIIGKSYGPEEPKTIINNYKYYLKEDPSKDISFLKQLNRKNELLSCFDFDNNYIITIYEYNNKYVSKCLSYIIKKYNVNKNMIESGIYSTRYIPTSSGLSFALMPNIKFNYDIYLKFYGDDELVISNTKTDKFYSINYFSDHITIGSSLKKSEVIVQTHYAVQTNLVILNRKGKLVFIFAYAKDGVEPIKDDFLLDILKPSLLTEGLH